MKYTIIPLPNLLYAKQNNKLKEMVYKLDKKKYYNCNKARYYNIGINNSHNVNLDDIKEIEKSKRGIKQSLLHEIDETSELNNKHFKIKEGCRINHKFLKINSILREIVENYGKILLLTKCGFTFIALMRLGFKHRGALYKYIGNFQIMVKAKINVKYFMNETVAFSLLTKPNDIVNLIYRGVHTTDIIELIKTNCTLSENALKELKKNRIEKRHKIAIENYKNILKHKGISEEWIILKNDTEIEIAYRHREIFDFFKENYNLSDILSLNIELLKEVYKHYVELKVLHRRGNSILDILKLSTYDKFIHYRSVYEKLLFKFEDYIPSLPEKLLAEPSYSTRENKMPYDNNPININPRDARIMHYDASLTENYGRFSPFDTDLLTATNYAPLFYRRQIMRHNPATGKDITVEMYPFTDN